VTVGELLHFVWEGATHAPLFSVPFVRVPASITSHHANSRFEHFTMMVMMSLQ
jgi:hypothetical protein